MDLELTGRKAFISGSTAGIGLATAISLAREGAHVVISARSDGSVTMALERIRSAVPDAVAEEFSGGRSFAEFEEDFFRTVRPTSLLKRFATPEEVAALVTYVCSHLSSATNGADGGVVKACF